MANEHILQELRQIVESRTLELAFQQACHQVEVVGNIEQARHLRIRILSLEDEKDALQSHIALDEAHMDLLERRNHRVEGALEVSSASLKCARSDLRMKYKEIETLKAELTSLHGVTMDSTKLLTEKLTLARELSTLKPEIDHLRSQLEFDRSILAEKLSLQQQVVSLQTEVETARRTTQHALAKADNFQAAEANLESQINMLQAQITNERRDRQRFEREGQQASTELKCRNTTLESRLDAFRTKLKTTKEQLKEAQAALEIARTTAQSISRNTSKADTTNPSLFKASRKRGAVHRESDTMIGTPGDLPAAKKSKTLASTVGEKSTFSITPFLNRSASVAPLSPQSIHDNSGCEEGENLMEDHSRRKIKLSQKPKSQSLDMIKKSTGILENTKPSKTNCKAPVGRRLKTAPTLEQVTEENNTETQSTMMAVPNDMASVNEPRFNEVTVQDAAKKVRKRKLLGGGIGKTLFDEDEGDAVRGHNGFLGSFRTFGSLDKSGFGGPKVGRIRALNTSMDAFGEISPRKER